MADLLLETEALRKEFGGLVAVNNVDFPIPYGAIVSLIGPNGAGKTTFFNMITGVYKPTRGRVRLRRRRHHRQAAARRDRARDRAHVPEHPPVQGDDGARERARRHALAPRGGIIRTRAPHAGPPPRGARGAGAGARAARRCAASRGAASSYAHSLAYGEQRRLEVARALATEPKLLLLDEPTAGMNPQETVEFIAFVQKLRSEQKLTVLMIEHDMKVVMGVSDRVTVLDYGDEDRRGDAAARCSSDPRVIEAYLGKAAAEAMGRRHERCRRRARAGGRAGKVLEVEGIDAFYGSIQALRGVSLEVREGEIVTLIGANGAGKSTTLRAINGIVHPRRGRIRFEGEDITREGPHDIVRRGISQSPEGRRLFPRMTVTENLEMGAFQRRDKAGDPRGHGPRVRALPAASRSGATRRPGRCPAASSRCARSAAR